MARGIRWIFYYVSSLTQSWICINLKHYWRKMGKSFKVYLRYISLTFRFRYRFKLNKERNFLFLFYIIFFCLSKTYAVRWVALCLELFFFIIFWAFFQELYEKNLNFFVFKRGKTSEFEKYLPKLLDFRVI